jgi:malic enzyme
MFRRLAVQRLSSTTFPPKSFPKAKTTPKTGFDLIFDPLTNKGTGFSGAERSRLGLSLLVPPQQLSLSQQIQRIKRRIDKASTPFDKFLLLSGLQDRNETLFNAVLAAYPSELVQIVYTPVVGAACKAFSDIFRRPRGITVCPGHAGTIGAELRRIEKDVDLIVITDGSRVLGLGDLGLNGMGISIGKLALYTAFGGVDPERVLPFVVDVGTNNPELLNDSTYLGLRQPRLEGAPYVELMDELMEAISDRWPNALVQFEDFSADNAYLFLKRYRKGLPGTRVSVPVFNDDIQGTAAVALAGLYSALRVKGNDDGSQLPHERIVILGAGSAGIGVAKGILDGMAAVQSRNMSAAHLRQFWIVDKDGLVTKARGSALAERQLLFARDEGEGELADGTSLLDVVREVKPTILLGLSGVGGIFTEDVVRAMAEHCDRPIIFPLSNPTANAECTPHDVSRWTGGRAIFAGGSPFDPIDRVDGTSASPPSQANNLYIFPAIGLATILTRAERVTNHMFATAARALADSTSQAALAENLLFPPLDQIRETIAVVAAAVSEAAVEQGVARQTPPVGMSHAEWVRTLMWNPEYSPLTTTVTAARPQ